MVNAAHPSPFLLHRATGAVEEIAERELAGGPLGSFEEFSCAVQQFTLQPGDCVVLFSDGVLDAEAADGRRFGEAGILAVVERADASPRDLLAPDLASP